MTPTTCLVGLYEAPYRDAPGRHPLAIQAECVKGALRDAGLSVADVDGLAVSSSAAEPSELGSFMPGVELAEYLRIAPTYIDSSDLGGAGPLAQVGHAQSAISAGLASVVVVTYGANHRLGRAATPADPVVFGPDQFELSYGRSVVGAYALAAQAHMNRFGTTAEQLAEIAVTCRANAALNPDARYRTPLTIEDVVTSPMISTPLRRLDCCVVTTGGGAVVVTSAERARDCAGEPISVMGFAEAVGTVRASERSDFTVTPGAVSGPLAMERAGVTPADIDVAQLYDSFTITTLLILEDLGFCGKGEGGSFVEGGRLRPDGELPINTDGGGLSSNHPGRRGIFTIIEAMRQLRGTGVGAQVVDPQVALAHGSGGDLSTAATLLLGKGVR